jgi:Mce-associated membrane protein
VEVDAGRTGGSPVTPGSPPSDRTRVRLNVVLYAVALLCVAAIGLLGSRIWGEVDDSEGFGDHVGDVVRDPEPETASRAGEKIGDARLEALPLASTEEQERTAAVIDAASTMANVFLNVRYDDVDAYAEAVRELATGDFREQFDKSTEGIEKVAQRAKSVQTGDVLWAGVVAVDEDSATVIVASSGTVANTTTKSKAVPRNYRLQLDLTLQDGQWLTRDLQFVP